MGKNKPRQNPDKPQNQYGGDYDCPNYDSTEHGGEFCHDEEQIGWKEFVKWMKMENGKLRCKGNRYNCNKERLKWLASLSEEKREQYKSGKK